MTADSPNAAPEKIHGHEVMAMMVAAGRSLTRAALVAAIVDRFGPRARFHTCSADDMTAAELVEFLDARGKFTEADGELTTSADRICSHDGEHA